MAFHADVAAAGLDGVPYDIAIAPYATVYAPGAYSDAAVPFLSGSNGVVADMVFANRQVRHSFLRNVLALVSIQLLLSAAVAAPLLHHKHLRKFLAHNSWVAALTALVWSMLLLVLAWSDNVRRRPPTNLALLLLLTVTEGLMMGAAGATWHSRVPVVFLLLSATVSLALIACAAQTAVDLTPAGSMLFAAFVILVSVILADTWLAFKTLQLLIGGCAALLFSAWLVYDVLMAATGDSSYVVAADEYVFATINVYTDIIAVSMYILQICTLRNHYDFDFN
eukprot:gene9032-9203_t